METWTMNEDRQPQPLKKEWKRGSFRDFLKREREGEGALERCAINWVLMVSRTCVNAPRFPSPLVCFFNCTFRKLA